MSSAETSTDSDSAAPEATSLKRFYPIGTPGKPWSDADRNQWKESRKQQRCYKEHVLDKLEQIKINNTTTLEVVQYGSLSYNPERYPLFAVKSKNWDDNKSTLLVTGGVHGYETSGVQGALLFLESQAAKYTTKVNVLVAPCISPWGYEHVERWNAECKDPNRSFKKGNETEESAAIMSYIDGLNVKEWACHLDLHETTDTDALEFMPAKHAEAGLEYTGEVIPDGFYLVGDINNPHLDFHQNIVSGVEKVTHIVKDATIIDEPAVSDGIILVPVEKLGLCGGITRGQCPATTTEVYPDSPRATDAICNEAQVAAIVSGIDYVLQK